MLIPIFCSTWAIIFTFVNTCELINPDVFLKCSVHYHMGIHLFSLYLGTSLCESMEPQASSIASENFFRKSYLLSINKFSVFLLTDFGMPPTQTQRPVIIVTPDSQTNIRRFFITLTANQSGHWYRVRSGSPMMFSSTHAQNSVKFFEMWQLSY